MSFILDALKKSEAERQRQAGPALLEVRATPPQRRYPLWALIVAVLLAINLGVLVAFLLRAPPSAGSAGPAASVPAAAMPTAAAPAAATPAPVPAPEAPSVTAAAATSSPSPMPPTTPAAAAATDNPADEAAAIPAADVPAGGSVKVSADGGYASLPSASELGGDLPVLRLDLLVYAERPAERYALINMHRVREGDVLVEGPRVLAITRDGVALSYRGQDFMLRPQ